jgi:hypothetical protein
LLESEAILVSNIVWIMPTLEDVFISTVRDPAEKALPGIETKN